MIDLKKIKIVKESKPFRVFDIIVAIALVIVIIITTILMFSGSGDSVRVQTKKGVTYYPLNVNRQYSIDDKLTLVVDNKLVWVIDSICDTHECERTGKIKFLNQLIVCSFNSIFIEIVGESDDTIITG